MCEPFRCDLVGIYRVHALFDVQSAHDWQVC
jgi:hypothetical protein